MKRSLAEWLNVVFGFRKFILMLFLIAVAIIFRINELINGSEMIDLLKATAIAFFSANGVEHVMQVVGNAMAAKNAPTAAIPGPADTNEENDNEDVK